MTQEQVLEGNLLIALFIGEKIEKPNMYPENGTYEIKLREPNDGSAFRREYSDWNPKCLPPFHLSWDWLMPVVEKIKTLDEVDFIRAYSEKSISYVEINITTDSDESTFKVSIASLFESYYDIVVKFIKWYNLNKTI